MKKIVLLLLATATCVSTLGAGSKIYQIKVGAMAGPEAELVEAAVTVAKEKYNLTIKLVTFTDYVAPNEALADKSIDVNAFQHVPYLEEATKSRGYKFAVVGKTFLYPMGVYSKKIKNLEEIKKGAKVSIPNDPSNEGRALMILEQAGLIKLKDGTGVTGTVVDIAKNPHDLKIITLDAAQLPRSLDDVDISVVNTTYASPAGLQHGRDTVFIEQVSSPYTNVIAARQDNKDSDLVKKFVKAFQSEKVASRAKELFGDSAVAAFKW